MRKLSKRFVDLTLFKDTSYRMPSPKCRKLLTNRINAAETRIEI